MQYCIGHFFRAAFNFVFLVRSNPFIRYLILLWDFIRAVATHCFSLWFFKFLFREKAVFFQELNLKT